MQKYLCENFRGKIYLSIDMTSNKERADILHFCKSENRHFFHNAFSIFDTEFIKKNKFDERLNGKEDRYWATEQIENGYDIIYNPYFVVKHHYTDNGATWKGVG